MPVVGRLHTHRENVIASPWVFKLITVQKDASCSRTNAITYLSNKKISASNVSKQVLLTPGLSGHQKWVWVCRWGYCAGQAVGLPGAEAAYGFSSGKQCAAHVRGSPGGRAWLSNVKPEGHRKQGGQRPDRQGQHHHRARANVAQLELLGTGLRAEAPGRTQLGRVGETPSTPPRRLEVR